MIPVVSFVGWSNSGKTTLLEKVVRELKLKGYRVGVAKHTHHNFTIDYPGKDSWRLAQAGSDVVAVSSLNKVAYIEHVDSEVELNQLSTFFDGKVDILLAEGYKNSNVAKILVLTTKQDREQLCPEEPLATILARPSPLGYPQFDHEEVIYIVNLLISQIAQNFLGNISQAIMQSF